MGCEQQRGVSSFCGAQARLLSYEEGRTRLIAQLGLFLSFFKLKQTSMLSEYTVVNVLLSDFHRRCFF